MAWTEIPVNPDEPDQQFTIELSGVLYVMRFRWNDRASKWTLDLSTQEGTVILSSIPMVGDWAPCERFKVADLPAGILVVYDKAGLGREPDDENFGKDVCLLYEEE